MKIRFNKKLILAYLNIGIISFCLTGCKIKNKSVTIVPPVETVAPSNDQVEIIWHIPDGYRLVNRDGEPQFAKIERKKITRAVDLDDYLPNGYKIITIAGQERVIKILPDGSSEVVLPTDFLPIDYQIGTYNGKLMGITKMEVDVLNYVKITEDDYDLPDGYEIAYIDGEFIGVKKETLSEEKKLEKVNNY